ncbi:MAG: ribosomal protein S18-alanine N-acetyltransferase [Defluviitaleaceae bacterium]|nr:ribosomal protein S18-alanine N-acetyltransferase [Defluviitaleaceae bacterium]
MIHITDMTLDHLDAVCALESRCFAIPWSRNQLHKEITENKHAIYKVALIPPGEIAGYASLWHIVNEGHINNIAIDEPYRRQGIASLLLDSFIDLAVEKEMIGLTLEVRVSNIAALQLYQKYGFKQEGLRKGYYADTGEDALIMWKYLISQNLIEVE